MSLKQHLTTFLKTRPQKNPPPRGRFKDSAAFFAYLGRKKVKYAREELEDVADELQLTERAREDFFVEAADWFGQKG